MKHELLKYLIFSLVFLFLFLQQLLKVHAVSLILARGILVHLVVQLNVKKYAAVLPISFLLAFFLIIIFSHYKSMYNLYVTQPTENAVMPLVCSYLVYWMNYSIIAVPLGQFIQTRLCHFSFGHPLHKYLILHLATFL